MVGRVAVLFALLAQGMAMASPLSFVRCARADGEQRLELSTTGCDCCGCKTHCHQDSCESHDHSDDHHHDGAEGPADCDDPAMAVGCAGSCCVHSLVEPTPQVRSRTASELAVCSPGLMPCGLVDVFACRMPSLADFRSDLQRPQKSPHLIAASVIVLRV